MVVYILNGPSRPAWASAYGNKQAWKGIRPWAGLVSPEPEDDLEQIAKDRLARWEEQFAEEHPEPKQDDGWDDWY